MFRPLTYCATILATALVAGCASTSSEPTFADAMRGYSDEAQQEVELKRELAKRWERGNKLEQTGEQRVARAEDQIEQAEQSISKARDAIKAGNQEIAEGRELKAESERRFRARFPELSLEPAGQDPGR